MDRAHRRRSGRPRGLGLAIPLLLLLASPPAARAQDALPLAEQYTLRFEYLWWSPTPSGEIRKGLGDFGGTLLDIEEDLAVEKGKGNTIYGTVRLGGGWKLRGGWTDLDFSGDTFAERPFLYGTLVARFGDQIVTSLKGNLVTADLEWDFTQGEWGFLGGLAGVRFFDVDTVMLNVATADRVAETDRLPIPVLGLAGRAYLGEWVSLEGQLAGITAGSRGHLWEWVVALRFHATEHVAGTTGYRSLSVEGQDDRDFFGLKLSTWTFGIELSL
jgi:hypothetical protein